MYLKRRLRNLEQKSQPKTQDLPLVPRHTYERDADAEERPWREECPTCAAMSDEEYAEYRARCKNVRGITHIIIMKSYEAGGERGGQCREDCDSGLGGEVSG